MPSPISLYFHTCMNPLLSPPASMCRMSALPNTAASTRPLRGAGGRPGNTIAARFSAQNFRSETVYGLVHLFVRIEEHMIS